MKKIVYRLLLRFISTIEKEKRILEAQESSHSFERTFFVGDLSEGNKATATLLPSSESRLKVEHAFLCEKEQKREREREKVEDL